MGLILPARFNLNNSSQIMMSNTKNTGFVLLNTKRQEEQISLPYPSEFSIVGDSTLTGAVSTPKVRLPIRLCICWSTKNCQSGIFSNLATIHLEMTTRFSSSSCAVALTYDSLHFIGVCSASQSMSGSVMLHRICCLVVY